MVWLRNAAGVADLFNLFGCCKKAVLLAFSKLFWLLKCVSNHIYHTRSRSHLWKLRFVAELKKQFDLKIPWSCRIDDRVGTRNVIVCCIGAASMLMMGGFQVRRLRCSVAEGKKKHVFLQKAIFIRRPWLLPYMGLDNKGNIPRLAWFLLFMLLHQHLLYKAVLYTVQTFPPRPVMSDL